MILTAVMQFQPEKKVWASVGGENYQLTRIFFFWSFFKCSCCKQIQESCYHFTSKSQFKYNFFMFEIYHNMTEWESQLTKILNSKLDCKQSLFLLCNTNTRMWSKRRTIEWREVKVRKEGQSKGEWIGLHHEMQPNILQSGSWPT